MAADLDVARLRNELQELSQQRHEVNERLRSWDATMGRGRGRGPGYGPAPGRGWGPNGPGRGMQQRLGEQNGGSEREAPGFRDAPGFRERDAAAGPGFRGPAGYRSGQGYREQEPALRQPPSQIQPAEPLPSAPRKALMSAVVVNGQTRMLRQQSSGEAPAERYDPVEEPGTLKRPAPSQADQNPQAQKRARRLFGALMGTLAKASAEEQQFQGSETARKRQEAMQRVREREREERQRAREVARQKELAEKQAEINKKRELSALADIKRLEIMTAERLQHRGILANFIRTAATPPLHWLPAAHNDATERLMAQQQDKLAEWKAHELLRLDVERKRILSQRAPHLLEQPADSAAANGDTEMGEAAEEGGAVQQDGEAAAAEEAKEAAGGDGERWESDRTAGGGSGAEDDRWQNDAEADGGAASDADADMDDHHGPGGETGTLEDLFK